MSSESNKAGFFRYSRNISVASSGIGLLRNPVGRKYDPQRVSSKPGLIFMCLNADVERQSEFVQQTRLLASSFQGLENETDPFLGQHGKGADVTTFPSPYGPLCIKGLCDFVRVRDGGYFFLPGAECLSVVRPKSLG
jgi:hypothetical protein